MVPGPDRHIGSLLPGPRPVAGYPRSQRDNTLFPRFQPDAVFHDELSLDRTVELRQSTSTHPGLSTPEFHEIKESTTSGPNRNSGRAVPHHTQLAAYYLSRACELVKLTPVTTPATDTVTFCSC